MRGLPRFDQVDGSRIPHAFLFPGTLHCAPGASVVTTVLGSCVAVCMTDRQRRFSGINHFVLPRSGNDQPGLRYGDIAIEQLLKQMLRLGHCIEDIEAKIFGGAAVLPVNRPGDAVGAKNVAVAVECLDALGIPVVARRTGGTSGMLIRLFTASGDVLVRPVGLVAEPRMNAL